MAGLTVKRKATSMLEDSSKRMRIEKSSYIDDVKMGNKEKEDEDQDQDEDHDEEDDHEDRSNSDDDQSRSVTTPITPFSPSRKLFPSQLKTIKCTFGGCTKTFNRPARLAAHLRSHNNERSFVCKYEECDKGYFRKEHLDQHILGAHTKERVHKCNWEGCDKSFMTGSRLKRHLETHEGHERFRCTGFPPCNQTFRKHQTLERHIRTDHFDLVPFPCTFVDPVTGRACDAGFDQGGSLRRHEDRVHGPLRFWCDECSAEPNSDGSPKKVGFRTKVELNKHITWDHVTCSFCDFRSSSQNQLEIHVESSHIQTGKAALDDEKPFPCTYPDCGKRFTRNSNLTAHTRSVHEGIRFTCCPEPPTFSYNDPQVAHWSGLNSCGRGFATKANLEDHIRTQHLGLPTVINANRPKISKANKKRRDKAAEPVDRLTGAAYEHDPARNIPCLVEGCSWMFTRDFDLGLHLASKHKLSPHGIPIEDDRAEIDRMYDQADLEWEAQRKAEEGGPFWFGAEEQMRETEDEWTNEEIEMRRLIDQDLLGA
jgi:general transcription factor IIIA